MWFFADFIKLAEKLYFFNVDKDKGLYSSRSYPAGENGFVINDKEYEIKLMIKLYSDDNTVKVEVKRNNGTNMLTNFLFGTIRDSFTKLFKFKPRDKFHNRILSKILILYLVHKSI